MNRSNSVAASPTLFAISDLHLNYRENRDMAEALRPRTPDDWLAVAGDVGHRFDDVLGFLRLMIGRFDKVLFTPGNHDLWALGDGEPRGLDRYHRLMDACRAIGVLTPEDPYPLWPDPAGPIAVAPLFVFYDYSLRPEGVSKEAAMAAAYKAGVVCTDELRLPPDPYPTRDAWCADRLDQSRARLDALPAGTRSVLIAHWPLHPRPVGRLRHPEFSLWCGTRHTEDWHIRYRAVASVHGHLHIPLTEDIDGVRHEEVSLGYPRERAARTRPITYGPRRILAL
jgi:3',5'-cyclic AMP phosphodiesterase CpdA